jgi:hypothetical protein
MLFSYADDGVPSTDPRVQAGIKFDNDVLNSYELMKTNVGPSGLQMIYHTGQTEDGSCTPNTANCDWATSGDGGFHYSMFALTKGLGGYTAPNLSDPNNYYAKVVDLLLSSQNNDGSWTTDGRDDYDNVFATGLSVAALGKVAVITNVACTMTSAPHTMFMSGGQTINVRNVLSSNQSSTETLVLRSLTGSPMYFTLTGTRTADCHDYTQYPLPPSSKYNTLTVNGSGKFGSSASNAASGYTIKIVIGDWGDVGNTDNTKADGVSFTVKNSMGTVVWSGTGTLSNGSEEETG